MEKLSKVVYRVPCSYARAYIRETVRRLETRMKDTRMLVRRGTGEVGFAQLAWENHHPVKWEETTEFDQARSPKELLLNGGLELPGCWMAALKDREA